VLLPVYEAVCCSVLQRVAACCSVLQCVAMCCSVLQCVAVHVLQCVAVYFQQCVAVCCSVLQQCPALGHIQLQCCNFTANILQHSATHCNTSKGHPLR